MIYEKIINLKEDKFYRHIGIHRKEFYKYLEYLKQEKKLKRHLGGRKNKLSLEEILLMALKYWKTYPTFSEMSFNYGLSESSCFRNINWVEDTLSKNSNFKLPKKNYPKHQKSQLSLLMLLKSQ